MKSFTLFLCFKIIFLQGVATAACPAAIPPLPQLPVPAIVPPPVATCPTPTPATVSGYLPITFVNNTGLPASEIFIAVLVNSSTQFLSFSGATQKLATITDFTPTTYLSSSAYTSTLDSFEMIAADTYTFYIPNDGNSSVPNSNVMKSSRILISLKEPLTYFINNLGVLQLPTDTVATNDNYFVLNDKVEFDLGSNGFNRLNLNLTGVDFFGLPLLVQANYKFLNGTTFTDACGVTGMPTGVTFSDVFTEYSSSLASLQTPFDQYWKEVVATYSNPPSSGGDLCNLRIFAPATAMGSTQTQSNPSRVTFPINYFLNSVANPKNCTWFNAVWSGKTESGVEAFYERKKPKPYLVLDATTEAGSATAKGYEIGDKSFRFEIIGGADAGKTITIPLPTSTKAFFTGAVSDYKPAIISSASAATNNQVFKVFATSIISGIIPIDCKHPDQITINGAYVQEQSADYFENNAILTKALNGCDCVANVPWYDFYSRTLLTIGTPNIFYTSAYSDFLGTDGTIVIVNLDTDNSAANITINLNDCTTGVNFPEPFSDTDTYDITVGIPANTTVRFGTSISGPFGAIPATADGDEFFLEVTYNSGVYSGQTFVTQIAPLAQIFHPVLPGEGVVTTTGTETTVTIGASP
ncbi:MAG: beta-1,3-glucanase family protein [Candidatus Algichlamydia australiensis]|nr:beta-1,3-glucanase family protein [Chlamydiales bacterium]